MKFCYFGIYDSSYSRNRIIIDGLLQNGVEVIECSVDHKKYSSFLKYFILFKKALGLNRTEFEKVIVGFPGSTVVWLAWILFPKKKIIFDAFLSQYDSNILDRRLHGKFSLHAIWHWLLDFYSCFLAGKVLLDTNAHIDYFVDTFKINRQKFIRVFVGAEDKIFYPRERLKDNKIFTVHFHGTYIPLQGASYIIEAIKILKDENIFFRLVGNGQDFKKTQSEIQRADLKNVEQIGSVPLEELPRYIEEADLCLGIFGDTPKANRVIPNKVFQYIAMGKPVITSETPAIGELFKNGDNIILCERANAESLAKAIISAKTNQKLLNGIGKNGYDFYRQNLSPKILVKKLMGDLKLEVKSI